MKRLRTATAIIWLAIGSGCAQTPEVRYVTRPLTLPPRPALPVLVPADVQCLSDDAYRRLVERDRQRRNYAEILEAIIRATHEVEDGRH